MRQQYGKPYMYPMGIITNVETNDLNEVITASLRKSNGEVIRRHVSDLILLEAAPPQPESPVLPNEVGSSVDNRVKRQSAVDSTRKTADLYFSNQA